MSDEFNMPNRSFRPGHDHIWTSLEKPDGVNGAMELYSHNMTSTKCDADGTCYFYIKSVDEFNVIHVYNMYTHPPGFVDAYFFYRAAMVQSWNNSRRRHTDSGNPDLAKGKNSKVKTGKYYPTWPGIWMMGNLGRAIFSASTNRIACNDNPGYGLNPNQGRGAPEIDVLEGSASLIGPGMPDEYRIMGINYGQDPPSCIYGGTCTTPGANYVGVPTAVYAKRGHKSWYQGLRYAANNYCQQDPKAKQEYSTIAASMKAGITENSCSVDICPASTDAYGDLSLIDGKGEDHWGINSNGTCYPLWNVYTGAYLCDPDNTYWKCAMPRNATTTPKSNAMSQFNYQMDAISANWPVHVGAYTDFVVYQIEWVTGKNGYSVWNVPQNANKTNPEKIMLEEPMYLIFNVALSSSWVPRLRTPAKNVAIDYIRLYQDLGDDLEADNYMHVGCDPETHPTKQWIDAHIDEYEDDDNKHKEVAGKAFCTVNDDCTIGGNLGKTLLKTGKCVKGRCECTYSSSWGGPRCTTAISSATSSSGSLGKTLASNSYGPPMGLSIVIAAIIVTLSFASVAWSIIKENNAAATLAKKKKTAADMGQYSNRDEARLEHVRHVAGRDSYGNGHVQGHGNDVHRRPRDNYSQNFV
ncbi:Concanavalin A-like lectin/glucanase domain [Phytophthora cactorum]|nr:Concanavalin A-like lectin/glucanase domain [Phytophthora cactorum]